MTDDIPTLDTCPTCGSGKREERLTVDDFDLPFVCGHEWHTSGGSAPVRAGLSSDEGTTSLRESDPPAPDIPTLDAAATDGFTDEECPVWNHSDDPSFDDYVVCLRCDHFDTDCPHECGPEFSLGDVADCLERRMERIKMLEAALEAKATPPRDEAVAEAWERIRVALVLGHCRGLFNDVPERDLAALKASRGDLVLREQVEGLVEVAGRAIAYVETVEAHDEGDDDVSEQEWAVAETSTLDALKDSIAALDLDVYRAALAAFEKKAS